MQRRGKNATLKVILPQKFRVHNINFVDVGKDCVYLACVQNFHLLKRIFVQLKIREKNLIFDQKK